MWQNTCNRQDIKIILTDLTTLGMLLELLQYLALVEHWVVGQMAAMGMAQGNLVTAVVETVTGLHWEKMLRNTNGLERSHLLLGLLGPIKRFSGMLELIMLGDTHTGSARCQRVV